jgi:hypothetical protein
MDSLPEPELFMVDSVEDNENQWNLPSLSLTDFQTMLDERTQIGAQFDDQLLSAFFPQSIRQSSNSNESNVISNTNTTTSTLISEKNNDAIEQIQKTPQKQTTVKQRTALAMLSNLFAVRQIFFFFQNCPCFCVFKKKKLIFWI